ncbi:MAG TPA: ATPase, T2SS/T4P/T4SS family [Gemmatimonadales bacterium]|nr:ATPase, T2SS/T4P/T4SS family [Gemmatimonadales bacterium]
MSEQSMLTRVLKAAVQRGAADVHGKAGDVFRARVDGHLVPLTKQRLTPDQTRALAATFARMALDDPRLDTLRDFDCSWGIQGVGRFRVNVLRQRSSFMVVLRVIPFSVPTPESLELPDPITRFAELPSGMVLVSGPAGSGKTSTVAAMVHHINRSSARHVLTLEDPIEYLHRDLTGSITQREIGTDTESMAVGIQSALRQDPDVLVIGELRDPVAMDLAIRAAETGILVIGATSAADVGQALLQAGATLHPDERDVGRMRLAAVLAAVAAQRLVPKDSGEGRRPIVEWLEMTDAMRTAVAGGAEPHAVRKAMEKAAKEGRAEPFPHPGTD